MSAQFVLWCFLACLSLSSFNSFLFSQEEQVLPGCAYVSIITGDLSKHAIAPGSEVLIVQNQSSNTLPVPSVPVNHIHNNTYNSQMQELTNSTKISMQTVIEGVRDFNRDTQKQLLGLWDYSSLYISENRWYIFLSCLAGGYGCVTIRMLYLSYQLGKSTWWSQWQKGVSLSQLFAREDQALIDELLAAVQQRYTTSYTLENFSAPIVSFLTDISHEEKLLQAYQFWVRAIAYTGFFTRVFPGNTQLVADIQPRLDRIKFLQSRVMHYMLARKVRKSKK